MDDTRKLPGLNPVAPLQFSLFRMFLGLYLVQHFLRLIPFGTELFSNQGMLPDATLLPTVKIFPNILFLLDTPGFVTGFLIFNVLLAILLVAGFQRRLVALLLWYGWACLLNRNIFISNPGLPYLGWILLALAVIPSGEPFSCDRRKSSTKEFVFPPFVFAGAWLLMGIGYTISGLHKAQAPSWQDGSALWHVLQSAIARDYFLTEWLLKLPMGVLKWKTWFVLGLESSFVLFCFSGKTRPWIWLAIICMHVGILLTVDFPDLTFGVLMIHLFTFDQRWLKPVALDNQKQILFFDGVCGLCNHTVDFLLSASAGHPLKFSPLQGNTAASLLGEGFTKNLNTLVYYRDGQILTRARAVALVLWDVGGFASLGSVLRLIPTGISDVLYDLVAANRYKMFGKKDACRMPTPEERARFC